MINEQIRCKEVRVIGEEGQQLGVMALRDALNMAKDAGVDLVMVSPSANPPVCRIVDYGKFKYEQLRREKEAKKKQKTVEVNDTLTLLPFSMNFPLIHQTASFHCGGRWREQSAAEQRPFHSGVFFVTFCTGKERFLRKRSRKQKVRLDLVRRNRRRKAVLPDSK